MVFATGITLIKLFYSDPWLVVLGWVLLPVSLFTFIMGVVLSIRMNKGLKLTADESV